MHIIIGSSRSSLTSSTPTTNSSTPSLHHDAAESTEELATKRRKAGESGITPRRWHSKNDVRTKLRLESEDDQDVIVKLNTTLSDVANKINRWESKMKSMENSIKLLQGVTSKGGAGKAKQISSFIRVSYSLTKSNNSSITYIS